MIFQGGGGADPLLLPPFGSANAQDSYFMNCIQMFTLIQILLENLIFLVKFNKFLKFGFSNRWCKRENVEPDALKEWKINIFKIIDTRISFYSRNTHLLPPKPKSSFRHLKRGIQDFHMNYVLVPADKAANNVVVV